MTRPSARIEHVDVHVYEVPTIDQPERDGTAAWSKTTAVVVELRSSGVRALGYSYITGAAAQVVADLLEPCVRGADPFAHPMLHARMVQAVRNHGREGVCACAIAAVDTALWDLHARLLDLPLSRLLGIARDDVPTYASGGFTSTPLDELAREIEAYVAAGHRRVKLKIGQPIASAIERARVAREAAGDAIELMVDGNGAYTVKEALTLVPRLQELGVGYFEEPVSSDDLEGLRSIRDRSQLSIAAGEYGYNAMYFRHMLETFAVDILQADATRCLGITGFMQAAALCDAFGRPLSAHCAPALHVHAGRAARRLVHVEDFFDHVRVEALLFEGAPTVRDGCLVTDWEAPGLGLSLRSAEAESFAA